MRSDCGSRMRISDSGGEQYSSEEFVELVVRTDPRPLNRITGPFADSANVPAHSHRPVVRVAAQLLELWRIVSRDFPETAQRDVVPRFFAQHSIARTPPQSSESLGKSHAI